MQFNHLIIYFFSGTGNSHRVAVLLAETARGRGIDSQVRSVNSPEPGELPGEGTLLGLVFPTHGFTAPWHILRFARHLPRGRGRHAFCIATRAGFKMGRIFTPGISGSAIFVVSLLLLLKGWRVRGATAVDMPSNWTAVHPGLNPRAASAIIARAMPRVSGFMEKLLSGRRVWPVRTMLYEAILGAALIWISLGYLLIGRFMLAKIWFASTACTRCGLCVRSCPVGALRLPGSGPPFWRYYCEGCMRCMSFCPERAIQASHAWLVFLIWLSSLGLAEWLSVRVGAFPGAQVIPAWGLIVQVAWWSVAFVTFTLAYYGLYLLSRFNPFNRLLSLSTFTGLYRRYREPGTGLYDIAPKGAKKHSSMAL